SRLSKWLSIAAAVTPARVAMAVMVAPSKPRSAHTAVAASSRRARVSWLSEFGGRPRRAGGAADFEGDIPIALLTLFHLSSRADGSAPRAGGHPLLLRVGAGAVRSLVRRPAGRGAGAARNQWRGEVDCSARPRGP